MIPAYAGPTARLVATTALVAVAVAASMLALTALVLPGDWVRTGLVGIALVAGTTGLTRVLVERRARRRRRDDTAGGSVVPTLVGAAVAAWYVLSRYGAPTSEAQLFVGPDGVGRVLERLGDAGEIIRSEVAPVPGTLPIALLTVGGTLAVLLLADALAGGLRWPAAVGLPLLALWSPPLVLVGSVPPAVFVVVVAALLLLLSVGAGERRRPGNESPPAAVRRAEGARSVVTTAVALVVALAAGLVAAASSTLPGYAGAWYQSFTTTGDTIQLSEDLDVLSSLTERSGEVVLTYTGVEDDVGPLRTYTATAFDGRRWQRGEERDGRPLAPDELLWPDDLGSVALQDRQDLSVTVGSLRDDQLPVTLEPRRVDAGGTWGYDPLRDEVVGDRTDVGDVYTLSVRPRDLDPEILRGAGPGVTEDAYLTVPENEHSQEVAELAAEVTDDADTAYDQAVALQRWLRDPATFTYSTQLPRGSTGDPVWDFLQHRTGYCVQFATTMSVMARTLGIPTRLGVGFLPGEAVEDAEGDVTRWQVTGQDSHAWPELYFEGVGWVRFEPTPATQTGTAPDYTAAEVDAPADAVAPQEVPPPAAEQPEPQEQTAAPTEPPVAVGPEPADTLPVWAWAALAAGLLVGAGATAFLLLRRRRGTDPVDAERAWQQVVAALAREGVALPAPTTPRQAPRAVMDAVTRARGKAPAPEVHDDLTILAQAVEQARYARPEEADESLTDQEEGPEQPDLAEVAARVRQRLADRS
ncbi:transglutaminase superfamily protein [Isoptericola sp. CG 20/1183]|uniref:Transglutaminase superfamily protein n=1 Tax=Isoptericola halotolerans TaxID=300560 RepID=A0ABX5ED55_9MICO|nr:MULTISPECIES: transglutaminase domain-containing protein [Isoptericola]PRZ05587.1 transglutaminase superfamily protein [Isoptericola halotolerans]PRZ06155.1 transglutaminase superfamily protein [Isoptericola sp. CG 20/1183]